MYAVRKSDKVIVVKKQMNNMKQRYPMIHSGVCGAKDLGKEEFCDDWLCSERRVWGNQ